MINDIFFIRINDRFFIIVVHDGMRYDRDFDFPRIQIEIRISDFFNIDKSSEVFFVHESIISESEASDGLIDERFSSFFIGDNIIISVIDLDKIVIE